MSLSPTRKFLGLRRRVLKRGYERVVLAACSTTPKGLCNIFLVSTAHEDSRLTSLWDQGSGIFGVVSGSCRA